MDDMALVMLYALLGVQVVLINLIWRAVHGIASELRDQTNELKAISELLGERRRDPA